MENTLDTAFEALKTYDWGTDRNILNPIDDAVIAAHGNVEASKQLETRLAALLKTPISRDAKDFVCRKLMVIGTAASAPALAELLPEKDHSHMARYALERISAPEAAAALRDALPKIGGELKVGVIGSLGSRRDVASVPALAALLADPDKAVASAAASALGDIGTPEAADALSNAVKTASPDTSLAFADAGLTCAERLLAEGKKPAAIAIYKLLGGSNQPKHVGLAAKQGLLKALKN
jgi:HEAT repeat protein